MLRRKAMAIDVHLWWIGADAANDLLMASICASVEHVFRARTRVYHSPDRPLHAFDARRQQHSSTTILKWLVRRGPPDGRIVAMTDADLFIPVLTFVYGEAQLGGTAAVFSTARLLAESGRPRENSLFDERVVKECIHELGHTFGLVHCDTPGCVMTRSVNVIEVDAKRTALCEDCAIRYRELRQKEGHHE